MFRCEIPDVKTSRVNKTRLCNVCVAEKNTHWSWLTFKNKKTSSPEPSCGKTTTENTYYSPWMVISAKLDRVNLGLSLVVPDTPSRSTTDFSHHSGHSSVWRTSQLLVAWAKGSAVLKVTACADLAIQLCILAVGPFTPPMSDWCHTSDTRANARLKLCVLSELSCAQMLEICVWVQNCETLTYLRMQVSALYRLDNTKLIAGSVATPDRLTSLPLRKSSIMEHVNVADWLVLNSALPDVADLLASAHDCHSALR